MFKAKLGLFVLLIVASVRGEAPGPPAKPASAAPIREIFVPFEDLNVILDNDHRRVFLTRDEYEDLIQRAKSKPQKPAPHKVALIAAQYQGELSEGRASIRGDLTLEVMDDGLFALPLNLAGVGIRSASLDGQPAPLFRGGSQLPTLLVQGVGQHKLEIQLTAPLQNAAAQQTLQVTLPTQSATRLNLSVPGNVELKGGAAVVRRTYDAVANQTQLEILPPKGTMALAMSLNNRLTQKQRILVARSVIVDEVTQGYERLHATVSYRVLHGTTDKLRLVVPAAFDVMKVESQLLTRWQEQNENGRKILEVTLREPAQEQVVLHLTFNRTPATSADWLRGLEQWKFPRLEILETAGQVAVIGLVVEGRLNFEKLETESLIPIDSAALASAMPASVLKAEPGAPAVRQVASYYAPTGDYDLTAKFVRPAAELKVTGNSLVIIGDSGLTLQGGFALKPLAESLFEFSFSLPSGWQITQVTAADGVPLPLERYSQAGSGTRVLIRLPQGIPIGQTQTVNYQATVTPSNWLAEWTTQTLEIPVARVFAATSESGAVAVQAIDDLTARPDAVDGLTPLLDTEKASFGLTSIPTALAYRYENRDFTARFVVERTMPSLAARAISFFKLQRDNVVSHHEISYDVREARTRQVVFSLPLTAPTELAIRGLENNSVKQFSSEVQGERRRWTVQLAERQSGRVRLAIDFSEKLPESDQGPANLSLVQAEDVAYQSGIVAIECDDDLDVSVKTTAREVDVGELAGAEYSLGRRVIGSFGYVGASPTIQATITRRDLFTLPPALIQRAELVTKVSASGRAQTVARYDLLSKATLLEIRLPPDSTLWTIYFDDQPTKPQRERGSLLLSLPSQQQALTRKLQFVYESTVSRLGISGSIDAAAPQLFVRAAGSEAERHIPQADLQWQLLLPSGYVLRGSSGTVEPDQLSPPEMAARQVLRFLYDLGGGIQPWYLAVANSSMSTPYGGFDRAPTMGLELKSETTPYPPAASPIAHPADTSNRRLDEKLAESATRAELRLGAKAKAQDMAPTALGAGKLWALEGINSLKIDIETDSAPTTTFRSLGDQPGLDVAVVAEERLRAGAFGFSCLVFLVGVSLTLQPVRQRMAYVVIVLLASTLPLLFTSAFDVFASAFDYVFFVGCALVIYFPIAALVLAIVRRVKAGLPADFCLPQSSAVANLLIFAALCVLPYSAMAQTPPLPEDTRPISIPVDAIIVPYDSDKPDGPQAAEKIFVPYAKYVELWNQANPGKKIDATPPPVDYAIAGTTYEAITTAGDFQSLVGRMEIQVYTDKPVAVPLSLVNGVLEKATVDGQAARLQVVEQQSAPQNQTPAVTPANSDTSNSRLLLLHLSGQGRKLVEFRIRLGLARQGGWRIIRGQVPVGLASALTVTVPDAGTEIRQQGLPDRATFETRTPGERIDTALPENGQIDWQWRPKTGQAIVDQALTARSIAAFDVREDSLRFTWQVRLDYGRAYRDAFSFTAPADYLVESVTGDNVRGWTAKQQADQQRVDVALLKPAQGSESLTLQFAKRGRVGDGELAEFAAPVISVEGAALEQGEIAVRKSPRLDLRTLASNGLTRADANSESVAIEQLADAADAAVLAVWPYQRFSYVRPPYHLTFSATELAQEVTAEIRAALRIAERDTTLDAAIIFHAPGPPLYRTRLYLPADFTLERIGPTNVEWSVTSENGRRLLTVQLVDGRQGEFTLAIFGKLPSLATQPADVAQARSVQLPKLEILDVQKQSGELVILPDPDTDVRLDNLRNAEATPLTTAPAWMKPEQQRLAKATLRYRTADYSAALSLTTRTPLVSARSITNIKVTPRSIEETVLFNFRIEQAGIRSLSVLVPDYLAKARVKAPLVKHKTIAPATDAVGQPLAGMTRLTLELQEFVRGDYAVLLEHDRLFATDRQTVTLPRIETGRTDRRLIALENTGRDELVIDENTTVGLDPINRQQQSWRDLMAVLGDHITQAYAARDSATEPSLTFMAVKRQEAERAGARIGLATTLLVVDTSGAYRALVQYRLTNATQQFLQLTLPSGARLWTAVVAGEPVKPAEAVPPQPGVVRIPLVKTAEGEGDYLVELKYGGRITLSLGLGGVEFPLIRQTSVNVELSQLRLLLPESRQWFNFHGTMRRVADDSELMKGFQSYLNRRIQFACSALASSNDYTKIRAAINLNESRMMLENSRSFQTNGAATPVGVSWADGIAANSALLSQAEQQAQVEFSGWQSKQGDNRGRLNEHFSQQNVQRAKNVVSQFGSNFDMLQRDAERTTAGDTLNDQFFSQNQLKTIGVAPPAEAKDLAQSPRPAIAEKGVVAGKPTESRSLRGGALPQFDKQAQSREDKADEAKLPEIAAKKELDQLQRRLADEPANDDSRRRAGGEEIEQLQKYQENLQQNLARGQQVSPGQQLQPGIQQPSSQDAFGMRNRGGGIVAGREAAGGEGGFGGFGGGMPGQPMSGMSGQLASNAPSGPATAPMPGGEPAASRPVSPLASAATPPTAISESAPLLTDRGEQLAQVAAGLASLDVQLPERGRLYQFTTPRGEIAVSANSVSINIRSRLLRLAGVLAVAALAWAISRERARQTGQRFLASRIFGVAIIVLGFASVLAGVLPIAGLLAVIAGVVSIVRQRGSDRRAACTE